jgi:hypothetical protein
VHRRAGCDPAGTVGSALAAIHARASGRQSDPEGAGDPRPGAADPPQAAPILNATAARQARNAKGLSETVEARGPTARTVFESNRERRPECCDDSL